MRCTEHRRARRTGLSEKPSVPRVCFAGGGDPIGIFLRVKAEVIPHTDRERESDCFLVSGGGSAAGLARTHLPDRHRLAERVDRQVLLELGSWVQLLPVC